MAARTHGRASLLLLVVALIPACAFDRSGVSPSGDLAGDVGRRDRPIEVGRRELPGELGGRELGRDRGLPDLAGRDGEPVELGPALDLPGSPVGLSFNGKDSRAEAADSASLDFTGTAMTMEAWIRITGPDDWVGMAVVGRHMTDDRGWTVWNGLAGYSNGWQWRFGLVLGPQANYYEVESSVRLPRNQWVHLAGSFGGNVLRIFVDGQLAGTESTWGGLNSNGNEWTIGCTTNNTQRFEGVIDEVRISSSARYTASFTVPAASSVDDASTRALWHLDENTGSTSADASGNGNQLTLTKTTWTAGKF